MIAEADLAAIFGLFGGTRVIRVLLIGYGTSFPVVGEGRLDRP